MQPETHAYTKWLLSGPCKPMGLSFQLEATPARTHGQAAVGSGLTLSDRFYTPTLIRPDNEREGWVMSHKLTWDAATSTAA
jgi:hypothetical protein